MNLRGLLDQTVTVEFDGVPDDLFKLSVGTSKSDAEVVAEVHSLIAAAAPDVQFGTTAIQAALYQDDDAHDTCTLTACLNPLHPGPCKGWKGTLFDTAPAAYHALESAKVDKANKARVAKIADLKAKGLPIPKKLLTPVAAKPHPDAGKTAKVAGGEAHHAGKAISDSAGVHVNEPGKVTLGQAVKNVGTGEKGPKGKKPTVASKGIAHVIAQEKVTPQYKLDKAATITPEQWAGLPDADKKSIRAELANVQKDGFGPQQKKATELLAKLPAPGDAKAQADVGKAKAKVDAQQAKVTAAEAKVAEIKAKLAAHQAKPKLTETYTPKTAAPKATETHKPAKLGGDSAVKPKPAEAAAPPASGEAVTKLSDALKKAAPAEKSPLPKQAAKVDAQQAKVTAAEKKLAEVNAKLAAHQAKPKLTETYTPKLPKSAISTPTSMTPLQLSKIINKEGSADVMIGGKKVKIGFVGDNSTAELIFVTPLGKGGGHYVVKTPDGEKHHLPKGALIKVMPKTSAPETAKALPEAHQATLDKIASGAKVVNIGNGHASPGLASLGLVAWNSDAKQFELTPEGHKLATPNAPAPAGKPKVVEMHEPGKTPRLVTPEASGPKKGVSEAGNHKLSEAATPSPAEKPKALPKHVTEAIAMANGHAPGASWSKNHLAAYQPLSAEEFHALPNDVQDKIVSELTKGQSKFLDPKKVAAATALLEKFKGAPGAPKAETPPKGEAVSFVQDLHNHAVVWAQAKKSVAGTPIGTQFLAAKQIAGLTDADNPDATSLHTKSANEAASALVKKHTALYAGAVMSDPGVKTAQDKLRQAAWDQSFAESVLSAKQKAFSKIAMKTKDGGPGLSPMEKATLVSVGKHMLEHDNPPTDVPTMDKLKADTKAAEQELDHALQAALKKANAPSPDDMSNAQIEDRAAELLGPAHHPKVTLDLAEMQEAAKKAQTDGYKDAEKFSTDVLSDPAVATKYGSYVSALTQLNATEAMQARLNDHLTAVHSTALKDNVDFAGNPLTAADKKVIAKHADLLKAQHAHLDVSHAEQEKKAAAAKTAFLATAEAKVKPAEPVTLTDSDQAAITGAYSNAWYKHAAKAVSFGVGFDHSQVMKAHPDYPALKQDLGDLKAMAGMLAMAHAKEHTALLNVPTDPETGALEKGPEHTAWLAAMSQREQMESMFNVRHKQAQAKLDKIRTDAGLKKRALPKLNSPAVKATAAESGYYKSSSYSGSNYGKPSAAKNFMLAKVGPKLAVVHQSAAEKKAAKLGDAAAKAASTPKIENAVPGTPVKLGTGNSQIWHIPEEAKKQLTADFKAMPNGKYLADPPEDIFANLVTLAAAHSGPGLTLSVDQVLKTIDETHSKNLGVANSGMLEKKVTDWLGTAAGKTYAESHSTPDAKTVKQLKGELDLPKGVTLEPGQKVQTKAGPGPFAANLGPKDFHKISAKQMRDLQAEQLKAEGIKWTPAQKKALNSYSASQYSFNTYLRDQSSASTHVKQQVIEIQSTMMPAPADILLRRGTGYINLPDGFHSAQGAAKLVGKTFQDKGFVSSTVAGESGHFSSHPLQLTIEAPKGTPGVWMNDVSDFKDKENEYLLAAGTKFHVISVEQRGGVTHMRVRVVSND